MIHFIILFFFDGRVTLLEIKIPGKAIFIDSYCYVVCGQNSVTI